MKPISSDKYDTSYFLTSSCPGFESYKQGQIILTNLYRESIKLGSIKPGMKVLDFGCGRGELVSHIAKLKCFTMGVDYSDAALKMAQNNLFENKGHSDNAYLAKVNSGPLPFKRNSIDRIFFMDVIEHLTPEEEKFILKEFWRTLTPEGRLIIHTPNRLDYDAAWKYYKYYVYALVKFLRNQPITIGRDKRTANEREFHINEKDPYDLKECVINAGFKDCQIITKNIYESHVSIKRKIYNEVVLNLRPLSYFKPLKRVFSHSLFAIGYK